MHQPGISMELVCVSCAINRDGTSASSALTLGRVSKAEIARFFQERLDKGSVLCTDHEPSFAAFAKDAEIRHVQLEPGK